MFERTQALSLIMKGCTENFEANSFEVKTPSVVEDGDTAYFEIAKNSLLVRFLSHGNLLEMSEQSDEGEFVKKATFLLDLEEFDDRDAKSLANEIKDSVDSFYGKKARKAAVAAKTPATVSKTAVKNGMSYDANTLASRITGIYPELKEAYKENFQKYEEFLAEDFFVNHANAYIMETIRSNDSQKFKRLFKILSDTYENGTNAVQDLVVVTILGEIDNDKELLEKCCNEINDDDFRETLIAVNSYLTSSAGKKAKELLKNPPKYKPKKEKKSFMSQMMAASMPPQQ